MSDSMHFTDKSRTVTAETERGIFMENDIIADYFASIF